ncbi:Phosphotransferase [Lymphocystis disease virus 1]|uniref:Phosphotransferase n=1 Tax=Fish lymphocystis disease virus TaxID=36363 RepID=UPI0000161EAA|nr:Phosphotransferase [Lymphocystis disease virus 1]
MSLNSQRQTQLIDSLNIEPKERGPKLTFASKIQRVETYDKDEPIEPYKFKYFEDLSSQAETEANTISNPVEEPYKFNYYDELISQSETEADTVLEPVEEPDIVSAISNLSITSDRTKLDTVETVAFLLEDRISYINTVKDLLQSDKIDKWDHCITSASKFQRLLTDYKFIGRGSYSNVYKVSYKDNILVVKESLLRKDIEEEVTCAQIVAELLESLSIPNLVYTFKTVFCDNCTVSLNRGIQSGKCYIILMELLDRSIKNLNLSPQQIESGLLQLLLTLAVLHGQYGIVHKNIKAVNILIKIVRPGGFWEYQIAGRTFYVPNYGVIFFLSDFGYATIYHAVNNETNYYGTRNATLTAAGAPLGWGSMAGTEIIINPFNSTLNLDMKENTNVVLWKAGDYELGYYTINKLTPQNLATVQIAIDLSDMRAYPAWEFMGDIYDLLRTFVGGNRFFQPGKHIKLTYNYVRNSIYQEAELHPDFIYNMNGMASRFLLADVMAAYLFPEAAFQQVQIIETYVWPQ